jgi:uncharacterized protein YbjT (DUF2867 family)
VRTESEITAFVAGATGYTGREVVRALRARGARVAAHVRPDSSSLEAWRARFGELGADVDATPWDEATMTTTLRALAPTHVFALLGTTRARAKGAAKRGEDAAAETYEKVDYGLTMLLARATLAAGLRPRFVYLSSLGVPEGPTSNAYLDARRRAEADLRASGLPLTIARPSFITGDDRDEDRAGERIGASIADAALKVARALGGRRLFDLYASTDGKTLGEALVRVALDPAFEGAVAEGAALRGAS